MSTEPWLAVGLGNPGDRYVGTRHNVGQSALAELATASGERFRVQRKARCDIAEIRVGPTKLILAAPHSFMNESGGPTAAALSYFGVEVSRLVVVQDEIDLPLGSLRVKFGGGDNGHNGLRSIRKSLGTGDWYRLRLGVGRGRGDAADHVLSKFGRAEGDALADLLHRAGECLTVLLTAGLDRAQQDFNS